MEPDMRAALIRDGIVENIIIAGEGYDPGEIYQVIPIGDNPVEIGATYDGQTFTPPAPPPASVPETVSPRQARLALLGIGMLDMVEQALAAIPGAQGAAARIDWEYATEVQRKSPLIAALGPALGLTSAQIDDLFRMAVTL
jgi:hypothetical protein